MLTRSEARRKKITFKRVPLAISPEKSRTQLEIEEVDSEPNLESDASCLTLLGGFSDVESEASAPSTPQKGETMLDQDDIARIASLVLLPTDPVAKMKNTYAQVKPVVHKTPERKKNVLDEDEISRIASLVMSPLDPIEKMQKCLGSVMKQAEEENDYEKQRLKRMQENLKALNDIGVKTALAKVSSKTAEASIKNKIEREKRREKTNLKRKLNKEFRKANPHLMRKSSRLEKTTRINYADFTVVRPGTDGNDEALDSAQHVDLDALERKIKKQVSRRLFADDASISSDLIEEERKELEFIHSLEDRYYTCEEYFTLKGKKPEFIQDAGEFEGWVEDGLRKAVGIAGDKEQAWEENGGGIFSFKNPTGKQTAAESAKETARKMLFKNPNCYFYRHTAPGYEHWQGDFTEPENERFLEVAKEHGVGTKWGLFATYIPNRVGYQCSNHYRAHFVEGGIIWDTNFMLDKYGKSVYVGRKNNRGGN